MDKAYLVACWQAVRSGLCQTIDGSRDEELGHRPFPSSWTVRELMLHIAQEEVGEFRYGILQDVEEFPAAHAADEFPTIASIKTTLEAVHAETVPHVESLRDADFARTIVTPWGPSYRLVEMLGHLIEREVRHRGELSLTPGMLGRKGLDA